MEFSPFLRYYQQPEHQPFHLESGKPAALLVHGFPGSPAEMRPLAEVLNRAGWTTQGHLLPGFGSQIDTLFERRYPEWVESVRQALIDLKKQHDPVLLVGFSMGCAVALNAAVQETPAGAILISPFWQLSGRLWSLLPVFSRIFPTIRPFRLIKLDFSDPEVRRGMALFMPEMDLDDPVIQKNVREFRVPIRIIHEIQLVGKAAWKSAPQLKAPVLILQGIRDELVRTPMTRQFVARLPGPVMYQELDGAHNLPEPAKPAWPHVEKAIRLFIEGMDTNEKR